MRKVYPVIFIPLNDEKDTKRLVFVKTGVFCIIEV